VGGSLYLADLNTVRWFDMTTGEPQDSVTVEDAVGFNDLEVAEDGTIYASQTGDPDENIPERLYKITPDGTSLVFVDGAPLARPNGVAFDNNGNIVVVNISSDEILTFSPEGELLETGTSLDSVNDGVVILPDGTMYISSVGEGTIAVIRPDQPAELVASGLPSAASICHDPQPGCGADEPRQRDRLRRRGVES
jgi:sugar lactone lactonase YvrE